MFAFTMPAAGALLFSILALTESAARGAAARYTLPTYRSGTGPAAR
jgi:hypothetical protein